MSPFLCERSFLVTVNISTRFSMRNCCTRMLSPTNMELLSDPKLQWTTIEGEQSLWTKADWE
jgi:hypothetical protein